MTLLVKKAHHDHAAFTITMADEVEPVVSKQDVIIGVIIRRFGENGSFQETTYFNNEEAGHGIREVWVEDAASGRTVGHFAVNQPVFRSES